MPRSQSQCLPFLSVPPVVRRCLSSWPRSLMRAAAWSSECLSGRSSVLPGRPCFSSLSSPVPFPTQDGCQTAQSSVAFQPSPSFWSPPPLPGVSHSYTAPPPPVKPFEDEIRSKLDFNSFSFPELYKIPVVPLTPFPPHQSIAELWVDIGMSYIFGLGSHFPAVFKQVLEQGIFLLGFIPWWPLPRSGALSKGPALRLAVPRAEEKYRASVSWALSASAPSL